MSIRNFLPGIIPVICFLVISSCAKMVAPTGGPKDTTPPEVVRSIPPPKSLYFSGRTIQITFNEYVAFDKLNEKFMISPPMDQKPEISLRGKTMRIEFFGKLKDTTTYTLYFQDAIKDLNEGNPLINYQFVFSTGGYIDSLSVTGNVLLGSNLEPEKNVLVMLYSNLADSAPRKVIPDYVTIADENGYFRIDNIRPAKYRLYALVDNNNNKRYDLQDELFAFYDQILDVNSSKNYILPAKDTLNNNKIRADSIKATVPAEGEYKLYLFKTPEKKYYLSSSVRNMPYKLVYTLSRPPDTLDFDFISEDGGKFFIERNELKDTMTVWLLDSLIWSKQEITTFIRYPFTDKENKVVYKKDTIPMRYFAVKPVRGKGAQIPYRITCNISGGTLKPGQQIVFTASSPLREPDTSKIKLFRVDKDYKIAVPYTLTPDTATSLRYILKTKLNAEVRYQLITDKGAFSSIYNDLSDSTGYSFSMRPENSFGHLAMILKNGQGKMVVQLLDNSEKPVAEKRVENEGTAVFPFLEKGKYRIRIIYDINGDGRWSTGDYDLKIQPEPVSYYPDEIEVKTDWRIEQDWDVSEMHEKHQRLRLNNPAKLR